MPKCLLVSLLLFFVLLILFSFLIFYIFNSYDPYIIMHSTKKKFTPEFFKDAFITF